MYDVCQGAGVGCQKQQQIEMVALLRHNSAKASSDLYRRIHA